MSKNRCSDACTHEGKTYLCGGDKELDHILEPKVNSKDTIYTKIDAELAELEGYKVSLEKQRVTLQEELYHQDRMIAEVDDIVYQLQSLKDSLRIIKDYRSVTNVDDALSQVMHSHRKGDYREII